MDVVSIAFSAYDDAVLPDFSLNDIPRSELLLTLNLTDEPFSNLLFIDTLTLVSPGFLSVVEDAYDVGVCISKFDCCDDELGRSALDDRNA
jgi:hypothetical protein